MSSHPHPDDQMLKHYSQAIVTLYQQFQSTPVQNWDPLTTQLEHIREEIETRIDAWMVLDEQLDELTSFAFSQSEAVNPTATGVQEPVPKPTPAPSLSINMDFASQPESVSLLWETPQSVPDDPIAASLRKAMGFYDLWLFEDAASLFRQVLRYEPNNMMAALFLAAAETVRGNHKAALPYVNQVRRSRHRRYISAAEEIAANAAYGEGEFQAAIDSLLKVVHHMPDYQDTWYNLGVCYTKLEDWSAAAGALSQALDLDPEDMDARELLVDVWMHIEEYQAGLSLVQEGLKHRPGHVGFLQRRARLYRLAGSLAQAEQDYRELLEVSGDNPALYNEYADLCLSSGQVAKAAAILKKCLSLRPQQDSCLLKLATIELMLQQPERTERILRKLSHTDNNPWLVALCQSQVQLHHGNLRQARSLIEPLLQTGPPQLQRLATYYYSRILWEAGHTEEAWGLLASVDVN